MLTPIWWMTGTLLPVGLTGIIFLFFRQLPRSSGIVLLASLWIAVSAMQAVATRIRWGMTPAPPIGLSRALVSLVTTGWMPIGLCIGGEGDVRPVDHRLRSGGGGAGGLAPRLRFASLTAFALVANFAVLVGFGPVETGRSFYAAVTKPRSGSSLARYVVYELTWRHVLDSPLIGSGWVSGPAARWLPTMPLGSHSSFYGVLYRGGALTFTMLCIPFLASIVSTVPHLQARRQDGMIALAMLLLIGVVAYGETFQLMVLSLLPAFIWLGSTFRLVTSVMCGRPLRVKVFGRDSGTESTGAVMRPASNAVGMATGPNELRGASA